MACPVCGSRNCGQIARGRFYCDVCCNEWVEKEGKITAFKILEDGGLFRLRLNLIPRELLNT